MRMTGFKNFIMRGNLVELAVAVVIGTQFSGLIKQFVSSFVNPLLSLVGGTPDFGKLLERNKAATTRDCPECTMSIPVTARRCPGCTAEITPATHQPQPIG